MYRVALNARAPSSLPSFGWPNETAKVLGALAAFLSLGVAFLAVFLPALGFAELVFLLATLVAAGLVGAVDFPRASAGTVRKQTAKKTASHGPTGRMASEPSRSFSPQPST